MAINTAALLPRHRRALPGCHPPPRKEGHRSSPRASLFTQGEALAQYPPSPGPASLSLPTASQHEQCQGCSSDGSASNLGNSLWLIILYPLGHGQGDSARGSHTPNTGPGPGVGGSPPSPQAPEGTPPQGPPSSAGASLGFLHLHPICKTRVPPRQKVGGEPSSALPPRGRPQAAHTGPTASVPAGKGDTWRRWSSAPQPGWGLGPAPSQHTLCQAELAAGGPGDPAPGTSDPLAPLPAPGWGYLPWPGGARGGWPLPGLQAAAPRQPRRKGHGTGGWQQRHTGRYLAMFFYFQF